MQGHYVKYNKTSNSVLISSDSSESNGWEILFKSESSCVINNMTERLCEVYIMGLLCGNSTINKL